jgi:hypothetical protein
MVVCLPCLVRYRTIGAKVIRARSAHLPRFAHLQNQTLARLVPIPEHSGSVCKIYVSLYGCSIVTLGKIF